MKRYLLIAAIVAGVVVVGLGAAAVGTRALNHPLSMSRRTLAFNEHEPWNRPAIDPTIDNAPPAVPGVFDGLEMRYDPFKPTDGPYPTLGPNEKIWVDVSIDQQLVYIFHGTKLLYTMPTSSGMEYVPTDGSPLGVYHIQAQRGVWFYVPRYGEGAKYWVSWLGHGVYLFHSVPMNRKKRVIPAIAARLLHEASHGCFHLTVPDAKWFFQNVPYGTTVVVERSPLLLSGARIYDASKDQLNAARGTLAAPSSTATLRDVSSAVS